MDVYNSSYSARQLETALKCAPKVSGAEVGQFIQISEVDSEGIPIAWIPTDPPSSGYAPNKLIYELTTTEQVDTISFTFSEEQQAELINAAGYMVFMKLNKANTITTADTNSGTVVVYLGNQYMKVNIANASPTGNVNYISYAISGLYVDNTARTEFMENNKPREEGFPVLARTMVRQENTNSVITTQNSRLVNYFQGTFTIEPAYPIGSGSCVKVYAVGATS